MNLVLFTYESQASQVVPVEKNPSASAGGIRDAVGSLGGEDPLEEGTATLSSIFAWGIPWTEEPGSYSPWGRKESDMTEQLNTRTSTGNKYYLEN